MYNMYSIRQVNETRPIRANMLPCFDYFKDLSLIN